MIYMMPWPLEWHRLAKLKLWVRVPPVSFIKYGNEVVFMCELFGVNTPGKIQLNHLLDVFFSHGDKHPHGWGMAFFENGTVQMEKQAVSSTKSARLREYRSRKIMSDRMIAHIRLATKGNMEHENCHPFIKKDEMGRTWTLAHNGAIFEGEIMALPRCLIISPSKPMQTAWNNMCCRDC